MTHTTPIVALVAALVGASSYANAETPAASGRFATQAQVLASLRMAQVELYSDHDAAALQAIRRARRELAAQPQANAARELAALDQAAWQVRHHDSLGAVATLDAARSRLTA